MKPVKGVYIYRFQSPLYFANGAVFKARLATGCGIDPYQTKEDPPGCFSTLFKKVGMPDVHQCRVLLLHYIGDPPACAASSLCGLTVDYLCSVMTCTV